MTQLDLTQSPAAEVGLTAPTPAQIWSIRSTRIFSKIMVTPSGTQIRSPATRKVRKRFIE